MRRNVHLFGPALRASSCRMALCCVLGQSGVVRERAVHFAPDDQWHLNLNGGPCNCLMCSRFVTNCVFTRGSIAGPAFIILDFGAALNLTIKSYLSKSLTK